MDQEPVVKKSPVGIYVGIFLCAVVAIAAFIFLRQSKSPNGNEPTTKSMTLEDVDVSNGTAAIPEVDTTNQIESENTEVQNPPNPTPAPTPTPVEPTVTPTPTVQIFEVAAKSFSFTPAEIRVKKGDTVRIVLSNTGGFHDWVLDEFSVRTPMIKDGETATVEFVADKTGSFEYYCSVGSHRQMGMKGMLIVE